MKRRQTSTRLALAACSAMAFVAVTAQNAVQAASGTADEQAACTPDVLNLCLAEIPNEKRIVACLNRKIDKLSPACRKVIDPSPKSKRKRGRAH